jgi:hypothetical protein
VARFQNHKQKQKNSENSGNAPMDVYFYSAHDDWAADEAANEAAAEDMPELSRPDLPLEKLKKRCAIGECQ